MNPKTRPEPKYKKDQLVTIRGQKGRVTDVMWYDGAWDYTIQVYISATEAFVKGTE
jgi:propanediol utilization protein